MSLLLLFCSVFCLFVLLVLREQVYRNGEAKREVVPAKLLYSKGEWKVEEESWNPESGESTASHWTQPEALQNQGP